MGYTKAQLQQTSDSIGNFFAPINLKIQEILKTDPSWQPHESYLNLIGTLYQSRDGQLRTFPSTDALLYKDFAAGLANMPADLAKQILSSNYRNPFNLGKLVDLIPEGYSLKQVKDYAKGYSFENGGQVSYNANGGIMSYLDYIQ